MPAKAGIQELFELVPGFRNLKVIYDREDD
jgi:allophanate hydrolase subunit 1